MVFKFIIRVVKVLPMLWNCSIVEIPMEDNTNNNKFVDIDGQLIHMDVIDNISTEWLDRNIIG